MVPPWRFCTNKRKRCQEEDTFFKKTQSMFPKRSSKQLFIAKFRFFSQVGSF